MPEGEISECVHHKIIQYQLNPSVYYCTACSGLIILTPDKLEHKTIKPSSFDTPIEILPSFFTIEDDHRIPSFLNKKDYLIYRANIIKNMKTNCNNYNLSLRTFFIAVDYLDRICKNMTGFCKETLEQISSFCVMLSAKFNETADKVNELRKNLINKISKKNFLIDEIYILGLLDYDLNKITSFDLLRDILHSGFILEEEIDNFRKIKIIYSKIEKILYVFTESNLYIEMTPYQMAISIIGFSRKALNLEPFPELFKKVFFGHCLSNNIDKGESEEIINDEYFFAGLSKISRCFKIDARSNKEKKQKNTIENTQLQSVLNTSLRLRRK